MELFWVLFVIFVVGALIWGWGNNAGAASSQYRKRQLEDSHQRELASLRESLQQQHKEQLTVLRSQLTEYRKITAEHQAEKARLNGIVEDLGVASRCSYPRDHCSMAYERSLRWLQDEDAILLLGPGQLNEYAEWASQAISVWEEGSRLSTRARCPEGLPNREADGTAPEPQSPLVRNTIAVISGGPQQLASHNLFEISTEQLRELRNWFQRLSGIATEYVVCVEELEALADFGAHRSACINHPIRQLSP